VTELVEMERVHLLTTANFDDTTALLANKPDVLVNKIVSHFQSLFAAPHIDGVLARMNHVYLQTTEQQNFMRVLRQLLGLDTTAGVNSCLKRLTHLLDDEVRQRAKPGRLSTQSRRANKERVRLAVGGTPSDSRGNAVNYAWPLPR
jgi:hypothetical protein